MNGFSSFSSSSLAISSSSAAIFAFSIASTISAGPAASRICWRGWRNAGYSANRTRTPPTQFPRARLVSLAAAALFATSATLRATILFGTGDPTVNTTTPTGALANSGWQYEGQWGSFLGTVIAPRYFITAAHIGGNVGDQFVFQGRAYTTTAQFADPYTDLRIWRVADPFPVYAQLYANSDEVGRQLVVIGRGTQRGGAVVLNNTGHGWYWGSYDAVQRWGQNVVTSIFHNGTNDDLLYATFDRQKANVQPGSAAYNEAHLSTGDSGGGVFIKQGGIWKLAGINYAVDGPFYSSPSDANGFEAALFDTRGFYEKDDAGNYVLVSGKEAVPSGFYATRISSRVQWILSIINAAP